MPGDRKPAWKATTVQRVWDSISGHRADPGSYRPVSAVRMVKIDHMRLKSANLLLVKNAHCLYLWGRTLRHIFTHRVLLRLAQPAPRHR
jgi:hypothetical protein